MLSLCSSNYVAVYDDITFIEIAKWPTMDVVCGAYTYRYRYNISQRATDIGHKHFMAKKHGWLIYLDAMCVRGRELSCKMAEWKLYIIAINRNIKTIENSRYAHTSSRTPSCGHTLWPCILCINCLYFIHTHERTRALGMLPQELKLKLKLSQTT